jgi:hypothetical protein
MSGSATPSICAKVANRFTAQLSTARRRVFFAGFRGFAGEWNLVSESAIRYLGGPAQLSIERPIT